MRKKDKGGWFAGGMSWGGGGGKSGRNSEQGQLNNHYEAAGESLVVCVWDCC